MHARPSSARGASEDGHAWLDFWTGYALADRDHRGADRRDRRCRCCWRSPILTYAERKVMAAMQLRKGPNVVGPFGLLQPFADGVKLLFKETIIPTGANRVVFLVGADAHLHAGAGRLGGDPVRRRLGARRHQCRHPLPLRDLLARRLRHHHGRLGVELEIRRSSARCARRRRWCPTRSRSASCIITVLLCVGSLNLTDIVRGAARASGSASRCCRCSSIFFISALAETNRAPFDLPEAESELVAGYSSNIPR